MMLVDIYTVMVDYMDDMVITKTLILPALAVLATSAIYWAFVRYADSILFYGLK